VNQREQARIDKLLADLGHLSVIDALKHALRMRTALRVIQTWTHFAPLDERQVERACQKAQRPMP
jgi:antirestriction protein ArdC